MLIPLKHENMSARRWPVVTIALIVINVCVFIGTQSMIESESPELGKVKAHILLLAARYPDLRLTPDAQRLVSDFRKNYEKDFNRAKDTNSPLVDEFDAHLRMVEDPSTLQPQADELCRRYSEMLSTSLAEQYAFVPAHPTLKSYFTANFLHGGWLHLIGNMWFLWLAGFVLEDVWGRPLYTVFYLLAGMAALQIHALMNHGSIIPTLGASGAVAGLMGAFLVRFPKMKIEMGWLFGFRFYRFKAEAYWLLPLWLLMEVFYGAFFGKISGTAHWAHVGGFVVGALGAVAIRHSGLEHQVNRAIETKLSVTGSPDIDKANELLNSGKLDEAKSLAEGVLALNPDSIDAITIVRETYRRRAEHEPFRDCSEKLCALYLKANAPEPAIEAYDDFLADGGTKLQAATWMNLCRGFETLEHYDRALTEYEKLAAAYPAAPQSLTALLGAARLCVKRLNRPQDALKYYQLADKSPVPHLDIEPSIQAGIKEAQAALGPRAMAQTAGAH